MRVSQSQESPTRSSGCRNEDQMFPFVSSPGGLLNRVSGALIIFFACGAIHFKAAASTIVVPAGGDLQAALNTAQCGDQVVLQAGASFSGNFILRNRGACTGTD